MLWKLCGLAGLQSSSGLATRLCKQLTCCSDVQHSKQLLWGWYTLRYYPPDALLEAIAKRLTPLVHNMDARTLSEFIWAFGGLNYEPSNMQLFLQVCSICSSDRHWQCTGSRLAEGFTAKGVSVTPEPSICTAAFMMRPPSTG